MARSGRSAAVGLRWWVTGLVTAVCLALAGCQGNGSGVKHQSPAAGGTPSVDPTPPRTGAPTRLSVSGSQVLDPSGQPIVLRGYNWGEWATAQPQDGTDNIAQGANSVRLPLRWWGDWKAGVDSRNDAAPGHIDPAHLALLDQTIARASAAHLWIVLFVDSNYGQGASASTDNFWTDQAVKQKFVEVWQFLVNRYANTPYIAAYEILPEPKPPAVGDEGVRQFYESIIPVLRRIDPHTPIVVGPTDGYNLNRLAAAHSTVDSQIIYTGDYFIFDNTLSRMADIDNFEKQFNAPVWINQLGIPSGKPDSLNKARAVLSALNADHIGWAWWTYRIAGSNPSEHGIYYVDANDANRWVVKPDWLALVGGFLHGGP